MAFLELIFLMLLTGYIFSRLWSVLGTRTGVEKPPQKSVFDQDEKENQDNIIILKGRQKDRPGSNVDIVIDQDDPFKDVVEKIRRIDPDFDLYLFKENAKTAYTMIIQAFVDKNLETLKMFLDASVFEQFSLAISKREKENQTLSNTIIGNVNGEVLDVTCRGKTAEITVRFKSQQRYITYNAKGDILDNLEEEAINMNDIWTFKRILDSEDPTWLLSKTKSES